MIVVLSPSKSMDMEPATVKEFTEPAFLDQSKKLVDAARKLSKAGLMDFMAISPALAELNHRRFKDWAPPFTTANAKQAVLAFTGDVYEGLDANSLTEGNLEFAQKHLRILSGLYGLLKPLDLIQPYRLEMGRPLATPGAKNLYEFWRSTLARELNREPGNLLVNLASQEYFKAIDTKQLGKQVVTPVFKDWKNGTYTVISFHAKKARGAMARHIVQNRIASEEGLLGFAANGYTYNAALSTPREPVFTRIPA